MLGNVLECYGVGTVLVDKENDTDEIMFHLPGLFPAADGEAVGTTEKHEVTTKSPTGDTTGSSGLSSNGTTATWLSFNSNRITSPNVLKGSKVVIYKWAGSSQYRWMTDGLDGSMRLETIIFAISASPNLKTGAPLTKDNYWIFQLSTHGGYAKFSTGQGNGEPTSYDITLNTKDGKFNLVDGEDNIMSLDSMAHCWLMKNQEQSIIAINKKDILISAENSIAMNATEDMRLRTKRLWIECGETFEAIVGKSTVLKSPDILFEGNIKHIGNTEQEGTHKSTGEISSDTDCVSAGISGKGHLHGGVQGGKDKSGGPVSG